MLHLLPSVALDAWSTGSCHLARARECALLWLLAVEIKTEKPQARGQKPAVRMKKHFGVLHFDWLTAESARTSCPKEQK